jgi:hypothetical protein
MSIVDANPTRDSDREWYARNRIRPDIIAEIGTTKFVLGLEIDAVWGQVGAQEAAVLLGTGAATGPQRFGATGGALTSTPTSSARSKSSGRIRSSACLSCHG